MLKFSLISIVLILLSTASNCQVLQGSGKIKNDLNKPAIGTEDKIYEKVEKEAAFPGGTKAWIKYLEENLDANVPVKKKARAGTYQVIVKFIVSKSGKTKGIIAETNHGHGMEKEVIRIIKNGPDWLPAMQDGHPVNAYRRQPVTFIVSEE